MTAENNMDQEGIFEPSLAGGTEISRYLVIGKTESGEYFDKYLAEDVKRSRQVTLTLLQSRHCSNDDLISKFRQKARAAKSINHSGFVRVLEFSEFQKRPFIAQEAVKGRSLREIVGSGELNLTQILDLAVKIGEVLRVLHKAGIVHENIRPSSILIDNDNVVHLIDCDWIGVQKDFISRDTTELTDRLGYLSPEQISDLPINQRSDIFSLGVTLYEMLTCRHPFRKAGRDATIRAITEAYHEPPSYYVVDMPEELESIISKALAGNPQDRYQHINEFLTDLKAIRADESLKESEALYRKLIERINDGICIVQDKVLRLVNRQLATISGRSVEELTGFPFVGFLHPDDIAIVTGNYARHMAGHETPLLYESGLMHKDGHRVPVEISAGRIMYEGRPAVLASIRDITERKRAEEAVTRSEARYLELFENILEGAYQTLPDGTILSINPALVQMLGYDSKDELYSAVQAQELYVNPEDRNILTQKLEEEGILRNAEFKLKCKDGRIITVMENARAIRDENGDIRHYEGLLTDITDRKKAEEQLQRLSSVVKQSAEGIALVDLKGDIEFINAAFAEMHGYTPEELQGKNLTIFHTKDQLPAVHAANKQIQETGSFSGEIWHVHRDGALFPTLMHNSILNDSKGRPIGMIGTARDITDLKEAEDALQESRAMLQSIFKSAPTGIGLVSNRILKWCNEKLCEITGYTIEELVDQSARMLYPTEEEFKRVGREKYAQIREKSTGSVETKFRKKDGTIIDVLLSSTPIDPGDHSLGVTFTALDITERKAAENMILAQHELALNLAAAIGLEETLQICLDAAISNSDLDCGGIYLVDEISGSLNLALTKGLSPEFVRAASHYDANSPSTRLVMTGKPVYTDYRKLDLGQDEVRQGEGLRLISILPILHENEVIACLNIASRSLTEIPLATRQILETTAAQIGGFVARGMAEKALQSSEANYRAIFDSANDAIFIHDIETTRILDVNKQMCDIFGYSREEAMKLTVADLIENKPPYDMKSAIVKLQSAIAGKPQLFEWRAKNKDGRIFWVEINLKKARIGNSDRILAIVRDITARKRADQALRDNEEKWRSLLDNSDDFIMVIEPDGTIQNMNRAPGGVAVEEVIGNKIYDFAPTELHKKIKAAMKKVLKTGKPEAIQSYSDVPDQGVRYFINKIVPMTSEGHTISVIWLSTDITERRLSEKEIKDAHDQLNATINALPDMLFVVDKNGRILDYRAPDPDLLYTRPEDFLNKRVEKIIPRDAADVIMGAIWEAVETGRSSGAVYSLEMEGQSSWFELSVAAKGDPKAPDARFIILVRNVTERHEHEIMLRDTTEKLSTESQALMEKNIALEQVFEHIDRQKRSYQQQIMDDVEKSIMPLVKKLKRKVEAEYAGDIKVLEANLNAVLAKDRDEFETRYARLTARESEICDMIKEGMSSKQISEILVLSQLTVQKHREQIRKKLGITNTSINLATYLRTR